MTMPPKFTITTMMDVEHAGAHDAMKHLHTLHEHRKIDLHVAKAGVLSGADLETLVKGSKMILPSTNDTVSSLILGLVYADQL